MLSPAVLIIVLILAFIIYNLIGAYIYKVITKPERTYLDGVSYCFLTALTIGDQVREPDTTGGKIFGIVFGMIGATFFMSSIIVALRALD
jgi:uncharacterized membrane protein YoaK (UPF0700 family)